MTTRPTTNGTHRCEKSCCEGSCHTTALDEWCNTGFVPVSSLSWFLASVPVFRRTTTLSSVSSMSTADTALGKAVLTAFQSSTLHNGHFCTASHWRVWGGLGPATAACVHLHYSGTPQHFSDTRHPGFIFYMKSVPENQYSYYNNTRTNDSIDRHTCGLMNDTALRIHPNNLPSSALLHPTAQSSGPLTFILSDFRIDMTLKYWSCYRTTHGLKLVHVITEVQNGRAAPFIKQNKSTTLCKGLCRSNTVVNVSFSIT